MGAGSSMVMAFVLHKVGMTGRQSQPCDGGWFGAFLVPLDSKVCFAHWVSIRYQLRAFLARWLSWFDEKLDRGWYFWLGTLPRKMVQCTVYQSHYRYEHAENNGKQIIYLHLQKPEVFISTHNLPLDMVNPSPDWMTVVGRPWCPYVYLSPWRWRPWPPPSGHAWPPLRRRRVQRVLLPSPSGHEERWLQGEDFPTTKSLGKMSNNKLWVMKHSSIFFLGGW